jgi:hypothetical protein
MLSRLFEAQVSWHLLALALVPTLVLGWLAGRLVRRLAARA